MSTQMTDHVFIVGTVLEPRRTKKENQGEREIELLQGLLLRGIQILACVAR